MREGAGIPRGHAMRYRRFVNLASRPLRELRTEAPGGRKGPEDIPTRASRAQWRVSMKHAVSADGAHVLD
eukprot:5979552-Pyramimonas_sp.AAC.1